MTEKRWWVVCWLSLGMVIAYIDRVNLTSAMPELGKMLALDEEQRGMALSAFFWTYTIGQIPAGMLVDRYGVRLLYTAGIVLWSLASMATVAVGGLSALIATRLIVGLGESGFLVVQYGWQAMFLMMGIGSLLWLGPWLGWVKSSDPAALPALPASAGGADSVSLADALKSRVMWGIIIGTYCYMYFVYYCMTWMPQYFQKTHGMSIKDSNWFGGVSFGGMAAVAAIGGWVADRMIARGAEPIFVRRLFTVAGFLLAAMQTLSVFTDSKELMIGLTVASLCGLGLATANYWALTQTLMPGAVPVAVQNTAANLAGIVAPWLTGWMVKQTGSFDAPIKAVGIWLLLGVFAYLVMVRRPASAVPAAAPPTGAA